MNLSSIFIFIGIALVFFIILKHLRRTKCYLNTFFCVFIFDRFIVKNHSQRRNYSRLDHQKIDKTSIVLPIKTKYFNFFFSFISELSSDIFLIKIGHFTATSIMDFGAFIWWCGFFPMAIFWFKWWWLSCTIQFTRSKWTIYIRIRWSNHLFNAIFKSRSTWKWWSMCFVIIYY